VHPQGNELWVMVLEKAFAKFMGSYAATEGGYPLFAMRAITGNLATAEYILDHLYQGLAPSRASSSYVFQSMFRRSCVFLMIPCCCALIIISRR